MAGIRTQNTYAGLHRIGLQDIFDVYDEDQSSWWKDIAPQNISTNQLFYRFIQGGNFPLAPIVSEATPIDGSDLWFGNQLDIYPRKRGLGFDVSTEALETDQYDQLMKAVPLLKLAFNQTKEAAAAALFNNMTVATGIYKNPDGLALASTAHTTAIGTTSNLITDALSPLALEKAVALMMQVPDYQGNPFPITGPFNLWVHSSQVYYAQRIVESAQQAGTNNNDKNVIGGHIVKVIGSPYFTNTAYWAIVDTKKSVQPFAYLDRRGLRVKNQEDIGVDAMKWRVTEMYAFFAKGWRGFLASSGSGA